MFLRNITMACAAVALMAAPATQGKADDVGAFIGGAIIGGVVGHQIGKNQAKQKRVVKKRYVTTTKKPSVSSAVRAERREIQSALNYFGFPAGTPDGVLGPKSKAAISSYQAHLNYPATGQLTEYEKDFLLTSYRRALAGGALTTQQIAANPLGPKGLLDQYRAEAAGTTTTLAVAPTVVTIAPQPQPKVLQVQPQAVASTGTAPALPNFLSSTNSLSLASHCNQVGLLTTSNGGFATEATLVDANFALNEQFCLARTYAISLGEKAASQITGFTPQQIEAQCTGFAPLLKDHVSALSTKPKDAVLLDVANFAGSTGQTAEQLAGTASICLSVGYRIDNMDVAAGSALLLAALGQPAYGELLGHHLAHGFGMSKSVPQAMPWYEMALNALETGQPAVFNPGDPTRTALLRRATANLNGAPASPQVQPAAAALPTFTVTE